MTRHIEFTAEHVKRERPGREPAEDPAGLACVPCGELLMIESDELRELDPFIAAHLPHGDLWLVTEGPEGVFTGRRRVKRLC